MELLETFGLLRTLLTVAGIRNLTATTDQPAAVIQLHYQRRGIDHKSQFTVKELLDSLTKTTIHEQSEPQGGYTDIADIP